MKLIAFTIENYRSILKARKIRMEDYNILIGPNNEGKSNILHALALAMNTLREWHKMFQRDTRGRLIKRNIYPPSYTKSYNELTYDWERDFPINKRGKKNFPTKITLEFELDNIEIQEFKEEIGSNINGSIPIVISYTGREFDIKLSKQGLGGKTLNKKSNKVTYFISKRIDFEYIPAIRTHEISLNIVSKFVNMSLSDIEKSKEYIKALKIIEDLQRPILDELSESIQKTVSKFLPSVSKVILNISQDRRMRYMRREVEIIVDDGHKTTLDRKGDGIQSIVALALMRHASEQKKQNRKNIIAIEEPESHLHPKAIHEIKRVIKDLSNEGNQIIITTHSPIFVDPGKIQSSIIVEKNKACAARNIKEIREILGIRISDNLFSARMVILVEGKGDKYILNEYIKKRNDTLRKYIENGEIIFDALGGASYLTQKAGYYKNNSFLVRCFVDYDKEAKLAVEKSIESSILEENEITMTKAKGKIESEMEDLYNINAYIGELSKEFGIDKSILKKKLSNNKYKWSDNIRLAFDECGRPWDKKTKAKVKEWMGRFAVENIEIIFRKELINIVENFVDDIYISMHDS